MPKKNFVAGTVLRAADVNEYLSTSRNVILNSDFSINQRAFTSTTTNGTYGFDRWKLFYSGGSTTYSAQAFTPGTAPVSGYEAQNYARLVTTGYTSSGWSILQQPIEDVRTFAGQTVTFSFWAKAGSGTPKIMPSVEQNFGSGGSPSSPVRTYGSAVTLSTSWARYSVTISVPSISGKTIGSTANTSSIFAELWVSGEDAGYQNATFDIWGIQVEEGSTATPFARATPTIASELTACQRYFESSYSGDGGITSQQNSVGNPVTSATNGTGYFIQKIGYKTTKRIAPTVIGYDFTGAAGKAMYYNISAAGINGATLYIDEIGINSFRAYIGGYTAAGFTFHYQASAEF